jgi:NADH:ubiquinone oxidoreductase subunit 4 (subunit M)
MVAHGLISAALFMSCGTVRMQQNKKITFTGNV